jgi:hypothetical protein
VTAPLASQLAQHHHRRATGLGIESQIGPDAEQVGQRLLNRALKNALGDRASQIDRHIEIDDAPERAILQAVADERYEVAIVGISQPNAVGFGQNQLPVRLARATN